MRSIRPSRAVTVSVVVPAFRAASTLGGTLESLRRQTRPDWEAIVVDDGSDDGTAAVAQRFSAFDSRVRLLEQRHRGVGAARNYGIGAASGSWLHFLDADDLVEPEMHGRLLELAAQDPGLDLLVAGSRTLAPDGSTLVTEVGAIPADLEAIVARTCPFNPCACLVRAEKVRSIGGFDESFRVAGDWNFWWRLVRSGVRAAAVPEVLASYWRRPDSLSTDHAAVLRGGLRIIFEASGPGDEELVTAMRGGEREARNAAAIHVGWCVGGLLVRQREVAAVLDILPPLATLDVGTVELANAIVGGALDSANCGEAAWREVYLGFGDTLQPALAALARFCGRPELAGLLLAALDASAAGTSN